MKFIQQKIEGVWLIEPESFVDARGLLRRHFCQHEFVRHGLNPAIAQTNISENINSYTLRGFHYQIKPFQECKTISCLRGSIYDIVVDLRPQSKTFLQWVSLEINEHNRLSIYLPAGCANAFLSLSDNTLLHYYMSEFYSAESYRGFRYNDHQFNFMWPVEPSVISDRDNNYPDLDINSL